MAIPDLLEALLRVPGPSGQEARAAAVWRRRCEPFAAEVDVDVNGSSWARVRGTESGPSLAVIGHIDEIGLHVTHIDDDGFLSFGPVGGWDPVNLVSQRVLLDTRNGPVHGVIGRKPIHLMDDEDRKRAPELKTLCIDVGAANAEQARGLVRIGDTGVLDVEPLELPNGRIVARSLDNRVGCYVAARAAQIVAGSGAAVGDFLAMAVV
jgi:putative aminopeptidase FrvX